MIGKLCVFGCIASFCTYCRNIRRKILSSLEGSDFCSAKTRRIMGIVKAKDLTFEYIRRDEEGNVEGITTAVDHVNMDIQPGEFIAILGHNGSGNPHLQTYQCPSFSDRRDDLVDGLDTSDEDNVMDVRQRAGMVFRIRTIRLSVRWWRKKLVSDRKISVYRQKKSGNVLRQA